MAVVMFSGSFNFSTFVNMEVTCYVECTFPHLFLYNVAYCFHFIIRFCYKSIVELLLTLFYNLLRDYSIACNILLLLNHCCSWQRCIASLYICKAFLFM